MRPGRFLAGVSGLIVGLVLTACSTGSGEPPELEGWHSIPLPGGMTPSSVRATGDVLLVGGTVPAGAGRAPAVARLPLDGTDAAPSPVSLTPTTPYGKVADLVSLAGTGSSVVALGMAHGGAHGNFRWTLWTGTTDGLVDRPQTFETFGGWDAGTLLGVATDARGPLIAGTWQGRHGPDIAVWRAEGERWVRQPTSPGLANTAQRQVAPRAVSQQDDGSVVVNGSVIDLSDGVRQSAAYWRDVGGTWTPTALPDPGARSEAWSTACARACSSVGVRDGSLAIWSGDRREDPPGVPVGDHDAGIVLTSGDRTLAVVSSDGSGRLLVGHGGRWRVYTAPDGIVRGAALSGSRLYLVTGPPGATALVVRDLADVLAG